MDDETHEACRSRKVTTPLDLTGKQRGTIVKMSQDCAFVQVDRSLSEECRTCRVAQCSRARAMTMRVRVPESAKVGDEVILSITDPPLVTGAVVFFLSIPVLLMLGYIVGTKVTPQAAWVYALAGALIGVALAFTYEYYLRRTGRAQIRVLKLITTEPKENEEKE